MGVVQLFTAILILTSVLFFQGMPEEKVYLKKNICSFDKNCPLIFDKDYNIKKIKPGIKTLLSTLHKDIKRIASQYNIDPRALAAVIATENTLNVSVDDEIQNFLANYGVTSVFGKKFSYGLGQIFPSTATKVDHIVAKMDKRQPYSYEQVAEALTNPIGAVKYAAAIIYDVQNKYKSVGFDISGDVAILSTLYNIGITDERLKKLGKGHKPRSNYFGLFAITNIKDIEDAIGWSPSKGNYKPKFVLASDILKGRNYLMNVVKLYPSPQRCLLQMTRDRKAINTEYPYSIKADGAFKLIRSTLSCGLERWSLIRVSSGDLGWVSNKILKKNSIKSKKLLREPIINNNCRIKQKYPIKRNKGRDFDIKNFFKLNCHLPAITDYHVGEQYPCNIKLEESIKMIEKILKSDACYKKVLIPNKYLYHYIYNKYKSYRSFMVFDNLHTNVFTFYSSQTSKQVITYLPELN